MAKRSDKQFWLGVDFGKRRLAAASFGLTAEGVAGLRC
jgi:hypothetical protein